jgi:four helix bundle protein
VIDAGGVVLEPDREGSARAGIADRRAQHRGRRRRRSRRDTARFYMIARGSATEVAALMDVLERRHLAHVLALRNGRRLSIRVIQMLTKVDARLRA